MSFNFDHPVLTLDLLSHQWGESLNHFRVDTYFIQVWQTFVWPWYFIRKLSSLIGLAFFLLLLTWLMPIVLVQYMVWSSTPPSTLQGFRWDTMRWCCRFVENLCSISWEEDWPGLHVCGQGAKTPMPEQIFHYIWIDIKLTFCDRGGW